MVRARAFAGVAARGETTALIFPLASGGNIIY
jgi:hypothetical protein